ncbi:MAG: hypothetical protein ACXWWC_02970 [Chitinophagaceae bacterium]
MLAITKAKAIKTLSGVALGAILFSFSNGSGGEGFEIYLNNKVVLQQYGSDMNTVKTLKLDQAADNDQLSIRYHHCGRVGKDRTITIKDGQDNVLKQWKFTDVSDAAAGMSCKVKDILGLRNGKNTILKLYYSSSELPKGRLLTSIAAATKNIAKL